MNATMKNLGAIVIVSLVMTTGTAARGSEKGGDAKSEVAKLKGTWVRELDGRTYIVTFNGEKFATIFEFAEGTATTSGMITVDPSKEPKHMDWMFAVGTGRDEEFKVATEQTIYQLDDETFRFCASRKKVRPEAFPDKEGVDEYVYLVFKRVK